MAVFSLHVGVATRTRKGKKLDRLCRYISRPAVSEKRLARTSRGMVRYEWKTPYRDGAIHGGDRPSRDKGLPYSERLA